MRTAAFFFVALCAVSALALAQDEDSSKPAATESSGHFFTAEPPPTTPTPTKPKTTTTTKAKTTTTTTQPKPPTPTPTKAKTTTTTTQPKPPTPTKAKTTTTPKPKPPTTTPKPKPTTQPKPPTTTPKPKTTTQPKPPTPTPTKPVPTTTTAKPTPPPPPKPTPSANLTVGKYNLTSDKKVCLMAEMALQIRLEKPKANGTFLIQPSMTKAAGSCEASRANLTLVFKEGFITLLFNKSAADNAVYVDDLSFVLNYPLSKGGNAEYKASNKSVHLFTAKVGHSYSCRSESLYMGNGLYLDIQKDRMQAFNLTKSNEFGLSDPCLADKPDYRVAIAVGVTLLVLICIVVVAYLLGRRRRTDGYQSL